MENYTVTNAENLRSLCIRNKWFRHGTNEQYEKLFWANKTGFPIEQIAVIIWTCSCKSTSYGEILSALLSEREEYWNRVFMADLSGTKLLRFHNIFGTIWKCDFRTFLNEFCDPENEEWNFDTLTQIERWSWFSDKYITVWECEQTTYFAEWIPYMHAYRLYCPKSPQKTVAYVEDLDEERAKRREIRIIECDSNSMHIELL